MTPLPAVPPALLGCEALAGAALDDAIGCIEPVAGKRLGCQLAF
jgi:hypothetical protein